MSYDDDHLPLARLFALGFRAQMDTLHARLRDRGYDDVGRSFGYVLLQARKRPVTVTDVASLMEISKQAASKLVAQLEGAGYVQRSAGEKDARARPVRLSARGKRLLAQVERIYAELEAEWAEAIGKDGVEQLRDLLTSALRAHHDGSLPAIRPT